MKKQLLIIGIIALLVCVWLSGCTSEPKYMKFRIIENAPDYCMYCSVYVDGEAIYTGIEVCGETIVDVNEEAEKIWIKDWDFALLDQEPHTINVSFYTYDDYWHIWDELFRGSNEVYGLVGNIEVIYNGYDDIIIRNWS